MIQLDKVTFSYNGTVPAVNDISMTVNKGEIFGFLGPNGAGKTTTIKLITGVLSPDAGQIRVNGVDIGADPVAAKRSFSYVPDNPDIFLRLKGIEYLRFMGNIYDVPPDVRRQRVAELAERFELRDALTDRIQSYSHGMRQKLILIGALLHNPALWILDEPMTGLDPRSSFELKNMMREHADAGNTVFFSTHVLDVAERVCDRVAVVDRGKVRFCGTIDEMRRQFAESGTLESMFLTLTADQEQA